MGPGDELRTLREHKADAERFLTQIRSALETSQVSATLAQEGGVPTLVVEDPHGAGPDAATLVVDSDAWIECTWTPGHGLDARRTADMIIAVFSAIHPAQ